MATIEIESLATIPDYVHPDDEFAVSIDISTWLDSDTISSVAYSAVDEDGDTATTTVLDAAQHTNTTTVIVPYIKGGTHDVKYMVKMIVSTAGGDEKTFYQKFHCFDYSEEL